MTSQSYLQEQCAILSSLISVPMKGIPAPSVQPTPVKAAVAVRSHFVFCVCHFSAVTLHQCLLQNRLEL